MKRTSMPGDVERRYGAPLRVIESEELTPGEKIELLENWRLDLMELQTAADENMAGSEPDSGEAAEKLREVNSALVIARRARRGSG